MAIEIDLCNHNSAPLFGANDRLSFMVPYGGEYPVAFRRLVSAAHQVNVVFTRTRRGEQWITAPDRPGDDFGATIGQFARYFGKESIVTDHHPKFAEVRLEDRIIIAWRNAAGDFGTWQCDLSVFADELSIRADERCHVINE